MNWESEDLDWLQDQTMLEEADKWFADFMESWNKLYKCLSQYPEYFAEKSISLYRYKWIYMLTTNRCFGTDWKGVCSVIPYAELINHENVDVQYDYYNKDGSLFYS